MRLGDVRKPRKPADRDCCKECLQAPQTPVRFTFEGAWEGGPWSSDETLVVTSRSPNAGAVEDYYPARGSLPPLDGPGWVEGYTVRDVC